MILLFLAPLFPSTGTTVRGTTCAPEVPLDYLQTSCWDLTAAWKTSSQGAIPGWAVSFDVSFLDTREAKYSFLWIRYGWHIRPSIPIKREWPVTTTLFFPNWSRCDIPCIYFWEEDGWKFTFSRVVWCSSRHSELLTCFFCLQHDLGIYLFMHFFWGGGKEMRSIAKFYLFYLNLTKMNKYLYVCICIYQISIYQIYVCIKLLFHFHL